MNSHSRTSSHTAVALAVALIAVPAATADVLKWDQEKVTAIAAELPAATRALHQSLRRKPQQTMGPAARRSFWRLRDNLRSVESAARRLHTALAAGEGLEETMSTYRRMISEVRIASRELQRIPPQQSVEAHVETVAGLLKKLRPFYEEEPVL